MPPYTAEQMAQLIALEQQLAELIKSMLDQMNAQPPAAQQPPAPLPVAAAVVVPVPLPVPSPAPTPIAITPYVPHTKAITWSEYKAGLMSLRVDDILPPDTPGTVTLPVTGHVLSPPQSDKDERGEWNGIGEGFVSYVTRVSRQCGSDPAVSLRRSGSIPMNGAPKPRPPNTGIAAWPQMADEWFNPLPYNPPVAPVAGAPAAVDPYPLWDKVPGHPNDPWISSRTPSPSAAPAAPATPVVVEG